MLLPNYFTIRNSQRITILSNDLNSEMSVSYASCVKKENCVNSDSQEKSYRFLTSNRIHK